MIVPDDRTNLNARLTAMQVGLGVMFFLLVVSFWAIQVLQHDKFLEEAENNHTREIPLRAPRGAMFDRHGKVLVENREALNISLVREQAHDLDRSMRLLAAVTGVEERFVRDARRARPRAAALPADPHAGRRQRAADRLGDGAPARAERRAASSRVPTRAYPRDFAAHLFGYVGEITLQAAGKPGLRARQAGSLIGQAGIEADLQRAADGAGRRPRRHRQQRRPRDSRARLRRDEPGEGQRVQLTIDADVQRAAEEGFRIAGYNGSAVMLDAAQRRDPGAGQRADLRSERLRQRHRGQDLGPADDRPAASRCRTAPCRAAIRRGRCSRSRSRWPVSRKA